MGQLEMNAIRDYLIAVGCKIEYPTLVHAFKKHLYNPDPAEQAKMRTQFKDYVNTLATVKLENNMKFIVLRPDFIPPPPPLAAQPKPSLPQSNPPLPPQTKPPINRLPSNRKAPQTPQQPTPAKTPKDPDPPAQPPPPPLPARRQTPKHLRRRWAIEACKCNYDGLSILLAENQKLATCKDFVNGYTALHWAAKFGNLRIIKLIAGKYGVSANIKSAAGYTPLHIAAMFNKTEAANLLLKSYNANPDIRDHSGKRPKQYWPSSSSAPTAFEEPMKKKLPLTPFKY